MGIINATPDSFVESSRYNMSVLAQPFDIVDVGACSTRPGAEPVGADEEWRRLEPVLREIAAMDSRPEISIDTYWSEVVRKAVDVVGPVMVNDVSAGEADPAMLPMVGRMGLKYVAMHHGASFTGSSTPVSDAPILSQVGDFFEDFALKAEKFGIDWILDPGFGFGKNYAQNWALLSGLSQLKRFGRPVLVGVSRKIMTGGSAQVTLKAHRLAVRQGADILRVHDYADVENIIE